MITAKKNRSRKTFYLKILGEGFQSTISLPLVFPHQWAHSCLAVSAQSGLVHWVVDGHLIEDTVVDTLKEAVDSLPTNLTGKLLLGAYKSTSGWKSQSNKVANLNIFSSML